MKNFVVVLFVLILAVLNMGCQEVVSDTVTVTLHYTTTGDDGNIGQATTQHLKWSYEPITVLNWETANEVMGLPQPDIAGTFVKIEAPNIPSDTVIYFAIILCDEVLNCATISNIFEKKTADLTAPFPITDLGD